MSRHSSNTDPSANDPTCDSILRCFSAMDECPQDWPQDWKPRGTPQVRRESTVFRLTSPSSGRSICIKLFRAGPDGTRECIRQHAALHFYHARSDHENGYTVPQPHGCVAEHRAVIMEWADGRTYGDILKRDLFSTVRRQENLRKVAGWLRWFHSQSEAGRRILGNRGPLGDISRVFDQVDGLGKSARAHDPAIRELIAVAIGNLDLLHGLEVDLADLHGDFKPTNLLISPSGQVIGLDFMNGKRGPVSQDICRFLCDLDLYRNLLGGSVTSSSVAGNSDFEVFLSAYGGRAANLPQMAAIFLYFLTVLRSIVHQRANFKGGVVQRTRLAVFRRIAKRLARKLTTGDS